jgi:hypothetical protein
MEWKTIAGPMTKRRILTYTSLAVVIILAFWIGVYTYFVNSEDWVSIESVIKKTDVVTTRVGRVQKIETSPFGYSYSSDGMWATARFKLTITGEKDVALFRVEIEKSDNVWKIIRIEER